MPKLEFAGQSARDQDNIAANPSRLINCYREPIVPGGRSGYAIKSAPGLTPVATLPGDVRAMASVDGKLFVSINGGIYQIYDGELSFLDDLPEGNDIIMSGNNARVTITVGGGYVVLIPTLSGLIITTPTPGAFTHASAHDYIGNYTVLTERNGRRFQWSDIANPTSLPALNFSTADGRDDNLVRPMGINGALYLFKETSHEVWYLTGGAGAEAFERQSGGVYDVGLKDKMLICKIPGGAFFIGDDGRANLLAGGITPVSTPAVEVSIAKSTPRACFMYEAFGHTFCAVLFADRPAWIYDIATGEWHERAESADLGAWQAKCSTKFEGAWYVGRNDGVLQFGDVVTDVDVPMVRQITSRTLEVGRRFAVVDALEVFPRQGFNSHSLTLEVSRDGGLTWSAPKPATIGPLGNYGQRIIWRALGAARQFTARLTAPDAVPFTINADCEVVVR